MDEVPGLKSRYAWLQFSLLLWLLLVFPLILPPIPLGPIAFSAAWNRFEELGIVKRARRFIGQPLKSAGFPMGWLVNVFINIIDIASLGLRSAFMAAWLADQVNAKATKLGVGQASKGNVTWLLKWLLLGNVVFLAIWIVYPGWVLSRFVFNIEQILYRAYHVDPLNIMVEVGSNEHTTIVARPALSRAALLEASKSSLSLLSVYALPLAPTETSETDALLASVSEQVRVAAKEILQYNVAIFWCNLAPNYPTHYHDVGGLLAGQKIARWVAFQNGKIVCDASSASESIAKALGIPATIRAIDDMVIGPYVTELNTIKAASVERPVVLFIIGGSWSVLDWVKNSTPSFLRAVAARNAAIYYIKLEKKGPLAEELRSHDIQWTGYAIWHGGKPVERNKVGLLTSMDSVLEKAVTWLTKGSTSSGLDTTKKEEYRYRLLPCYILARWEQVVGLSTKQPVMVASGLGMDINQAESAFLRKVGVAFANRKFTLAIAPAESMIMEGSVASGLRAAGHKSDGCYVMENGKITGIIAESLPQITQDGWLNGAVNYLLGTRTTTK